MSERRIYNLPDHLLDRVRRYQSERGLRTESAAVRELLAAELSKRDRQDQWNAFCAGIQDAVTSRNALRRVG